MSKLIKNCFIALSAVTALSMTMGVQRAKADQIDDQVNECIRLSQSRPLTSQEIEICNTALRYQQERELRKLQLELFRQNQENIKRMFDSPEITPTYLGL